MATQRHQLEIVFESDWHVGTGQGLGGTIDRAIARDDDGLPMVPAKTLTGILRDASEQVAAMLHSDDADWFGVVAELFGSQPVIDGTTSSPVPATVSVRAAHLEPDLVAEINAAGAQRHELAAAATIIRPGVAIDPRSGQATAKMLRMTEMGRCGSRLTASLEVPDDLADTHRALLAAAITWVSGIGGKRRRGAGRCTLRVDPPLLDGAAAERALGTPPATGVGPSDHTETEPGAIVGTKTAPQDAATAGATMTWWEAPVEVVLRSPVVVPEVTLGNVVRSKDHIPGAMLLAALARAMTSAGVDLGSALADRALVVGDCRPSTNGTAAIPTPLALTARKGSGRFTEQGAVRNLVHEELGTDHRQIRSGHIVAVAGALPTEIPSATTLTTSTHNSVDDTSQRPLSDIGGVYTYEALQPGLVLQSVIRMRAAEADGTLEELSDSRHTVRLGTSKKDDYGQAELHIGPFVQATPTNAPGRDAVFTALCTSDAVVLDDQMRYSTRANDFAKAMGSALGMELEPTGRSWMGVNRRDGFRSAWSAPAETVVAIAAGSCIELKVLGTTSDGDDRTVDLAGGIGEFTGEGCGQVVINHHLLSGPLDTLPPSGSPDDRAADSEAPPTRRRAHDGRGATALDAKDTEHLRSILTAVWRQRIGEAVTTLTSGGERGEELTKSQLSAVRQVVQTLGAFSGDNQAGQWLEQMGDHRAERFTKDLVEGLKRLFTRQDAIWKLLELDDLPNTESTDLRSELWGEAVRTLVTVAVRKDQLAGVLKATSDRGGRNGA